MFQSHCGDRNLVADILQVYFSHVEEMMQPKYKQFVIRLRDIAGNADILQ